MGDVILDILLSHPAELVVVEMVLKMIQQLLMLLQTLVVEVVEHKLLNKQVVMVLVVSLSLHIPHHKEVIWHILQN